MVREAPMTFSMTFSFAELGDVASALEIVIDASPVVVGKRVMV